VPEGDAIFRTARTLHRALAGRVVTRFESVFPALTRVHEDAPVTGRTVERVESAGKHVLMRLGPGATGGGLTLRTHMRMSGSWHIYRPGERWQRPRRDMRIVVATDAYEAVAFTVPVAEFLLSAGAPPQTPARSLAGTPALRSAPSRARSPRLPSANDQEDLRALGPDLLGETFDEDEALRRIRARGREAIADVLLNQRVVAGIGNVYKSEVLFLSGVDPFAAAADVPGERLREALNTARELMRANVTTLGGGITTYIGYRRRRGRDDSQTHYVYGRARKPCRRCGAPIRVRAQGPHARLTYWCPRCQAGATDGSASPT
jgi:endonuclease-8